KMPHELLNCRELRTIRVGEHGVHPDDEPQLAVIQLVATLQPTQAFEIGTYLGHMTALIAMNMPEDGRVRTLDLPPEQTVPEHASDRHLIEEARRRLGSYFRDTPWMDGKITQLLGDTRTFDFSPYKDAMDFVLIDASHTYEFAFNDSMHAFRMIRENGVLLWHDYESMRSEYGVTRFVDRLRRRHGCPAFRLGSSSGDTRYAAMHVSANIKTKLAALADRPDQF
ncbi:MAG: class I SAM-dependent methyltransferase, partial [Phycisphaerae bacterium]